MPRNRTAFGGELYDPEHSGCVLSTRVDIAGMPVAPARVWMRYRSAGA